MFIVDAKHSQRDSILIRLGFAQESQYRQSVTMESGRKLVINLKDNQQQHICQNQNFLKIESWEKNKKITLFRNWKR